MINYRYEIVSRLGEGGSGEVFLVEDVLKRGQRYAIKILFRPEDADIQFLNEISLLTTLRHPGLLRVFDSGTIRHADETGLEGRRFFTMEHIQGLDVLRFYQDISNDDGRVSFLHNIVAQSLDVLSYIHHRGIVHFDVKPENLLLLSQTGQDESRPQLKLTDFGFSVRHKHGDDLSLRGTLEYTAPELLRGQPYDHRIDLYSLGATLFHLVEGRCPFEASSSVDLIKKVLTSEPSFERLSDHRFKNILGVVQGLLQRDAAKRFPSAGEARQVFVSSSGYMQDREFVAKPAFVGREKELDAIASGTPWFREENSHSAIILSGPEGIGKTALIEELVHRIRAQEIPVFEMDSIEGGIPFEGIAGILPILEAEVLSRTGTNQSIARYSEIIEACSTSGAARKGLIDERERLVESVARAFVESANLFPFTLIADNAEGLDKESREILLTVARDAKRGTVLLLVAEREPEFHIEGALHINLGELDEGRVIQMASSVIDDGDLGEVVGKKLFGHFGGVPALVVEALHSIGLHLSRQVSAEQPTTDLADTLVAGLPVALDDFLHNRFASLDREYQLVLELLSCLHFPASLEFLRSLFPFRPERLLDLLAFLEASELVESGGPGQTFSMSHERFKQVVYDSIKDNREETHRFIASVLEGSDHGKSFTGLQELANQKVEGGYREEGAKWFERAGDKGMSIGAYRRARKLYEDAAGLRSRQNGTASQRIRTKLAHAMFQGGEYRESVDLTTRLLAEGGLEPQSTSLLHRISGLSLSCLGEYEDAKTHLRCSLETSRDEREVLELQRELLGIDISLGNLVETEVSGLALLNRARQVGDRQLIASICNDLGIATFYKEEFDRSKRYFQDAMTIYTEANDHIHVADSLMNIGNVTSAGGNSIAAIDYWQQALRVSEEHGTLNQQWQIQNNIGIAHYKLKRYTEARDFYERARAIAVRIDSKQGTAFVLTNLGEVYFAECDYERALRSWEDALSAYRSMEDARGMVETLLQLIQVQLLLGDLAVVRKELDEVGAMIGEKDLESFKPSYLYQSGMFLFSCERFAEARKRFSMIVASGGEGQERVLLARIRIAECESRLGDTAGAIARIQDVLDAGEQGSLQHIVGESCLALGMLTNLRAGMPLTYFKKGLEAIEKDPVSELTWQLAFGLGKEFQGRGQREKAKEALVKAKVVLHFIGSQFQSEERKKAYLAMGSRNRILEAIETYLNP